jgi:hypothetical protein
MLVELDSSVLLSIVVVSTSKIEETKAFGADLLGCLAWVNFAVVDGTTFRFGCLLRLLPQV